MYTLKIQLHMSYINKFDQNELNRVVTHRGERNSQTFAGAY